jgi:type IV secretory pathway TraG/TraD family ATPase VirD4
VGPTQVGKTSSFVVPALLRWRDALVVASVKHDVVDATQRWRSLLGDVQILEPDLRTGLTWDPLEDVTSFRRGVEVARDLTLAPSSHSSGETEFWNTMAVKLLGAMFTLAKLNGGTIFDVVQSFESRAFFSTGNAPDEVVRALDAFGAHEDRTRDAVATTAEAMLLPWHFSQPLANVHRVLDGANTLYLCAPRHNQRHYEGLFRGALHAVLEEQQRRVESGRGGRLLMVLDEAAAISPLDDLDQLAATVSGLNVTLVTIFQDFAQIEARWPERAPTIVNNHATRVVFGGLLDPRATTYLPEIFTTPEGKSPRDIRRWPRGSAIVVSGRLPLFCVRLRPWWKQRALRNRGDLESLTTMPAWSSTTPLIRDGRSSQGHSLTK